MASMGPTAATALRDLSTRLLNGVLTALTPRNSTRAKAVRLISVFIAEVAN